jgi:hypothetical protein
MSNRQPMDPALPHATYLPSDVVNKGMSCRHACKWIRNSVQRVGRHKVTMNFTDGPMPTSTAEAMDFLHTVVSKTRSWMIVQTSQKIRTTSIRIAASRDTRSGRWFVWPWSSGPTDGVADGFINAHFPFH